MSVSFFISDFIPFFPNLVANHTPISSITPPRLDPPHTPCLTIQRVIRLHQGKLTGPWEPELLLAGRGSNTYFMQKYDNKFVKCKIYMMLLFWIFFDILSLNVKMYIRLKSYTVPFFVSGQTYKISKGSNNYCSHCKCHNLSYHLYALYT